MEGEKFGAFITAFPNPVPAGVGFGTTTITWNTGDDSVGYVFVSRDGQAEVLFTSSPRGSQEAPWIADGHEYYFRLYTGEDRAHEIAALTVKRHSMSWEEVSALLAGYAARPDYRDQLAELLGDLIPYCLISSKYRSRYFHLWKEHGVHVTISQERNLAPKCHAPPEHA